MDRKVSVIDPIYTVEKYLWQWILLCVPSKEYVGIKGLLLENGLVNDVTCRAFEKYFFNFQVLQYGERSYLECSIAVIITGRRNVGFFSHGSIPNEFQYNYDFICRLNAYIMKMI